MLIAYYAPMKAPNHHRPSGDRALARWFAQALLRGGHRVEPAALLRAWDGSGDPARQRALAAAGARTAAALVHRWRQAPPQLWFTYHLYHKAPDWIGPAVSEALGIPYVVAEASLAPGQRGGPWDAGLHASEAALHAAAAVVCLNPHDEAALRAHVPSARLHRLAPFRTVPAVPAPRLREGSGGPARLVTVAMMRPGAKLESYRQLAAALRDLTDLDWNLDVIGDGRERAQVATLFAPLGARVRLLGALAPAAVLERLGSYDLCVWPAHREALGMALLEAQMCGVPVVAGTSPGVAEIVRHERTGVLVPSDHPPSLAAAVRALLRDPQRRWRMACEAHALSRREHTVDRAAAALNRILAPL